MLTDHHPESERSDDESVPGASPIVLPPRALS